MEEAVPLNELFDLPPDGGAELEALLQRSGVDFRREGDQFRFRFTSGGCAWQTVCRCQGQWVLVYGIHPAPVRDPTRAQALCGRLNARVVRGSFFLQEGRFIFRSSAYLSERFEAQARIADALEYNAAALSHWWQRLAGEAADLPMTPESESRLAGVLEE